MFIVQKNTHEWATKSQGQMKQIWETIRFTEFKQKFFSFSFSIFISFVQRVNNKFDETKSNVDEMQNQFSIQSTNERNSKQHWNCLHFIKVKSSFWFTKQISITSSILYLMEKFACWMLWNRFRIGIPFMNVRNSETYLEIASAKWMNSSIFFRNMWMIFQVVRDWLVRNFFKNIGGEGLFR